MSLTRDEQRVVRALTDWIVVDALLGNTASIPEFSGRSHFTALGEERGWVQCTRTKITVTGPDWEPRLTLAWAKVVKHGTALPADLRDRLAANREARGRHAAAYPRFSATAPACGHGRPLWAFGKEGPLTEGQQRYADEYAAWEASGVMARWEAEKVALWEPVPGMLDEAFPLAVDDEPTDLLELLAVTP